jgi:UDP-N-acetyl-2-amino-2-deoxyglucuronate dehydrogenase
MPDELKLALVGCGVISRLHLDGIQATARQVRVTAAVDPVPERAQAVAAETGAIPFTSFDDALEQGDFDAVDLMLPHHLHEAIAVQSFEAGKHVLLEKPMATSLDACERILAAARQAGTVFMVAENAQYWPEVITAGKLIDDGRIGELITTRANFVVPLRKRNYTPKQSWRCEMASSGGGIVLDGGSHWLRPLRMWMGEVDEVIAALGHPVAQMQGESLARALLRFESGKLATFDAMLYDTAMAPGPWWRITGTQGEITIDDGMASNGGVYLYNAEHPQGSQVQSINGYKASFGLELLDFSRAILDGKPLDAGPEYALGELRLALAMYRSAETKQWEKVWD